MCTPVGLNEIAAEDAADARSQVNASSAQALGMLQAQQQHIQSGVPVYIPCSTMIVHKNLYIRHSCAVNPSIPSSLLPQQ
jgi:hypothetical protein